MGRAGGLRGRFGDLRRRSFCQLLVTVPLVSRRSDLIRYMRSTRFALPPSIFALSSSQIGAVTIHWVAGAFSTNGQSTANRIRSIPISIMQHNSAGLEKLPLVVM